MQLKNQRHLRFTKRTRASGFSLVEVMVSLIIIAVGMLGLAKLQALAYASTGIASKQSLAALEASSLVSAMRANRNYWTIASNFTFSASATSALLPGNVTVTMPNPATGSLPLSDGTLATAASCVSGGPGSSAPCTAPKLAAADLQNWMKALGTVLPNPSASISCPAPVGTAQLDCTVTVTWVEETVGVNAQSQGNTMTAPSYTLYVVP
jgi:type IV pilus assembly protein PilV